MKKHIVCLGDSNTHGYCADPYDSADGGKRYNEEERWPCVLQSLLGKDYLVLEEGLSGRTTVFDDPLHGGRAAIDYITPCLISHEPVDLLIIMLGTNDVKERFCVNAAAIGVAMQRLVRQAQNTLCWSECGANVLVVAPPPLGVGFNDPVMGEGCREKSLGVAAALREAASVTGVHFFDAVNCEFNSVDHVHLSRRGHTQLARALAELVPALVKQ